MAKDTGEPGWKWRRLMIFPLVIYGCRELSLLKHVADTEVNERLADGWFLTIIALAFFFTGFATAQDIIAIWRTKSGLPYSPPPNPDNGAPPYVDRSEQPGVYPQ